MGVGTATPVWWHHPNNLETAIFEGLAGVAPSHPIRCHRHPCPVTNGNFLAIGFRPLGHCYPLSSDHTAVFGAPAEMLQRGNDSI
jgi:hypothetical protein